MLIVSGLIGLYMLLIIIRLLLTWFRSPHTETAGAFLHKIVGPYLNLIRRLFPIRIQFIDLSPVIALAIAGILFSITGTLAWRGMITWGILAGTIIGYLWYIAAFILDVLTALCLIRLVSLFIGSLREHPFLESLDDYLYRVITPVTRFFNRKQIRFQTALVLSALFFLAIRISGTIGIHILTKWLMGL
jgi:YggT family protein